MFDKFHNAVIHVREPGGHHSYQGGVHQGGQEACRVLWHGQDCVINLLKLLTNLFI